MKVTEKKLTEVYKLDSGETGNLEVEWTFLGMKRYILHDLNTKTKENPGFSQ